MSGEIGDISGAVGEGVLGAGLAGAVEPKTGTDTPGPDGHTHESACLNCDTPLMGAHCHNCGQRAHVHRSLRGFMHDLVHGVLHFEGKFWRTMPLLIWRPGKVMREYIDGKRARYLSPIALFLFTVFVSFALFNANGGFGDISPEVQGATSAELQESLKQADRTVADLNDQLASAELTAEERVALRERIRGATASRDLIAKLAETGAASDGSGSLIKPTITVDPSDLAAAVQGETNDAATASSVEETATDEAANWLEQSWEKARDNPGLLLYKLQTNAYKLSWLLIPLSLPFMWILFPFSRRFKLYDHTVVVTYSISFMTMLAVIMSVGIAYQIWPLIALPALYAPFHLYRSLRGAYGLSRFGAIWRMLVLSVSIWITMTLFILIMIGIVVA
ncbi:DUF3667 domain-containing protein [Altererythrobacter luteolus]|uniref:DUF3667 domain-containing protein n=1 Tax=Pontixanthobacter luteolus TaxID=295089 RepID=A0A6I4V439_9SPHN|nr:DUF3667 domain-containing protein [Pontixanthobacter luteolus]MXP47580.1 DUF3667 domain-containing protein [Pontixanthobacter luteolus]